MKPHATVDTTLKRRADVRVHFVSLLHTKVEAVNPRTAGSSSAGMNLAATVAVCVGAGSLAQHTTMLPTEPVGLQ